MASDLPFTGAVIGNHFVLLMLERDPAILDIQRKSALATVVDFEASRQELVQRVFQLFRKRGRDVFSLDAHARLVPVLHAVDGP